MIARLVCTFCCALFVSACATESSAAVASSSLAARAQAAQPVVLTWAWPAGSEAAVEETVLRQGTTAVERYRVRLLPVDGKPALHEVAIDNLHLLMLDGRIIDPDKDAVAIATTKRMAALLPRMLIDDTGTLVDVVGIDGVLETIASTMSEAERGPFLLFMKSVATQELLRAAGEKIWNTWVGGLVGLQAPPGEDLVAVTAVAGPDGPLEQETHFVLRHASDNRVVVETRTDTPAPVARALLMPMVKAMIDNVAGKNAAEAHALLDKLEVSIVSSTSTELEPRTMRPHRAHSRQNIRVVLDGTVEERVEEHDYVFTWKP